jgi:hypothetical protein
MPRKRKGSAVDQSLFEAALIGFEQMRRNVEEKIGDIRRQLGGSDGTRAAQVGPAPRRTLSAAARRRIAAAQRKRWAAAKAQAKPATAKRTMSAAARKRIAAAQRKRWAAVKKALAKAATKRTAPKKAVSKAAQTAAAAS